MSEGKDQLIERLTQRAGHELADESGHVNGYTPEEIARWSLRAMRAEGDGLEALLAPIEPQVVRLSPVYSGDLGARGVIAGWDVEIDPDHGGGPVCAGYGPTIRAAVKAALGKGNAE